MKKYVKEYKGHKVPEGATHYRVAKNGIMDFYKEDPNEYSGLRFSINGRWWATSTTLGGDDSPIPLPEAPQEWMPEVGDRIVICFDDVEEDSLNDNEIAINGSQVTFIGSLVNGVGQAIFVYDDNDNFSDCYPSECFRPLKTQQEKDREAFKLAVGVAILDAELTGGEKVSMIANALFDAGFTAPKAEK